MVNIHLTVLPEYFNYRVPLPPLGIACLSAYLKKKCKNIHLTYSDLRLVLNKILLFSGTDHYNFRKIAYVSEIPDLQLILALINNFMKNGDLFYNLDNVLQDNDTITLNQSPVETIQVSIKIFNHLFP